jgi:hypothetical protein
MIRLTQSGVIPQAVSMIASLRTANDSDRASAQCLYTPLQKPSCWRRAILRLALVSLCGVVKAQQF